MLRESRAEKPSGQAPTGDSRAPEQATTERSLPEVLDALAQAERAAEQERAGAEQLQQISAELIHDDDPATLNERLVEAAVTLMSSQFGSMQVLESERHELRLVAWRGFDPASAEFWQRVAVDDGSSCAVALERGERVVVPDVETAAFMAGTEDLDHYRRSGIRSVQSTPLRSREGRVVGMISTHWDAPHEPAGRELRLLDVLARQAADLVERAELVAAEQEARREAERRAHATAAFTFGGDGMVVADVDGCVRSWNPAAERIIGIAERDLLGRPLAAGVEGWSTIAERIPVAPADAADPRPPQSLPLQVGDREIWLLISGTTFEGGTVYTFGDVSAERALDRMRADLIATVSHELRTPLAAIYGAAATLRRRDLGLDDAGREQFVEMIEEQSARLARIVEEILLASRVDGGELTLALEPVDPVALAREIVDATRVANGATAIAVDAPVAGATVLADTQKLGQVLHNLVENALRYSDGGTVEVAVEAVDGRVRFTVTDHGIGIAAEDRERIFDKFYRVDSAMTRGVGGTGLGLYICRELVRRMNGRIWVESEPNVGSRFTFELPVEPS